MPFTKKINILIIDDNFLIREVIKSELLKLEKEYSLEFQFYSADNGLVGLGYLYAEKIDFAIVDTTLPKYSGREIIEFISSNLRLSGTRIIALTEENKLNLPSNFVQISKKSKTFLKDLIKEFKTQIISESFAIKPQKFNFLPNKIINLANLGDLWMHEIEKRNVILRKITFLTWVGLEILTSVLYSLYSLTTPRAKESTIERKNKDVLHYRIRVYPSLILLFCSIIFLALQSFLFSGTFFGFVRLLTRPTAAASYTWDGGGDDASCGGNVGDGNKWSCAANWSSDIVPINTDDAVFDGTSTKDATIDSGFAGTITNLTISAGYTGTITQSRSLTLNGTFIQSDGFYTASNQSLTIIGSVTLNSGANFTASSGTTTTRTSVTINTGATFNHNNGTWNFAPTGGATIVCQSPITWNFVTITNTGIFALGQGCTLPLGNNPTTGTGLVSVQGTLVGTGTITFNGSVGTDTGADFSGFTSITVAGNLTIDHAYNEPSITTIDVNGDFNLSSDTGDLIAPSILTVAGNFTILSASTFHHNSGTVTFDGTITATLNCSNAVFNLTTFSHTGNAIKTINSNCNLPTSGAISINGGIVLNGTLTGNALLQISDLTLNSGSVFTGFTGIFGNTATGTITVATTWNAGSYTIFNLDGSFALNSGANFTAPSGNAFFADEFTINAGATFNHNNGTITFDSNLNSTLSCNNAVFNTVGYSSTGNKVISSNCTFPMGAISTASGTITLNGTITSVNGTANTGNLTLNSGSSFTGFTNLTTTGALTVATTLNASSYNIFNINGNFVLNSGGVFTAPSGTMSVQDTFTLSAGSTFNHNNGTINFDGSTTVTLSCNNATFNLVTFTHSNNVKTVSSNCNFPLGNNPTVGAHQNLSQIALNGTLSGTGTITTRGTFTLNSTGVISGFTAISSNNFTYSGGSLGSITSLVTTGTASFTQNFNASSYTTFTAGGGFSLSASRTFTAHPTTMTVGGNFTLNASSTFVHNNGTVVYSGTGGVLSCNNQTFNQFSFTHSGLATIQSNCSIPVGSNPSTTGSFTLTGTITGTGSFVMNTLTLNATGVLSGFNSLTTSGFTYNGGNLGTITSLTANGSVTISANLNASSFTTFDLNNTVGGSLIVNVGVTFTAPPSMTIAGEIYLFGTYNHNNGTITFDGTNTNTISCNNKTFYLIAFAHTASTKTINSDCNMPLGNNPTTGTGHITLNGGTISGTGAGTFGGNLTFTSGSISGFTEVIHNGSYAYYGTPGIYTGVNKLTFNGRAGICATFDHPSITEIDANENFYPVDLGCTNIFIAPATIRAAKLMQIDNGTNFNANGGTIILDGTSPGAIGCITNTTLNLVKFEHTDTTKNIVSRCTLSLGNNPVSTGSIYVVSLVGSLPNISGTGKFTVNGSLKLEGGPQLNGFDEYEIDTLDLYAIILDMSSASKLTINEDFRFTIGTFTPPPLMEIGGDFENYTDFQNSPGTFIHNNGTVEFIGNNNKTIYKNNTFYNLKFAPTVDPDLIFEAGTTQTILGTLTLKGTENEPIFLKSTTPGSTWGIDPQGTYDIEYVNVSDSININPTILNVAGTGSVDEGNNTGWSFYAPTVSNLGPTEVVDGGEIDNDQPNFTFNISDQDGDDVKYEFQLSNSADFSSLVIGYTSVLSPAGDFTFIVGQPAGSGTYSHGTEGMSLVYGYYYWRVRGIDELNNLSDFNTANSGNYAFAYPAPDGTIPGPKPEEKPEEVEPTTEPTPEPNEPGIIVPLPLFPVEIPLPETGGIIKAIIEILDLDTEDIIISLPIIVSIALPAFILSATMALPVFSSSFALKDAIFRVYSIPAVLLKKKKKSWGIVFDEVSNTIIPFAVIDLLDTNGKLVAQTTSDLKGKYGFLTDKNGEYELEVRADGFDSKKVYLSITGSEVIQDLTLNRIGKKPNAFNRAVFYSKTKIIGIINIILLSSLIVGLIFSIYGVIVSSSLFNILMLLFYITVVLINILLFISRRVKESGKVVDNSTKKGIKGAIVRVYGEERQLDVIPTNAEGKIKVNIKPGKYLVLVTKDGYIQTTETTEISISESGYMSKEILMEKQILDDANSKSELKTPKELPLNPSPFG